MSNETDAEKALHGIDERFSKAAFVAAGLNTDAARTLADDLADLVAWQLMAVADRELTAIVETLNGLGHNLQKMTDSPPDNIAYRDEGRGSQTYARKLRVAYDGGVATGYAHLYSDDDLCEEFDEPDEEIESENVNRILEEMREERRILNQVPPDFVPRPLGPAFSPDAFEAHLAAEGNSILLSYELKISIHRELHSQVNRFVNRVIARLNALGHNLRPDYDPEPGDYAYRDDWFEGDEYHCRLRVGVDDVISVGYRDLIHLPSTNRSD